MKKIAKKLICLVLALMMILPLVASCKKEDETADTEDTTTSGSSDNSATATDVNIFEYSVVRAEDMPEELKNGISEMYAKLVALSGKDNEYKSDLTEDGKQPNTADKEILVGHTNRPETEQVLSQLAAGEYAVAVVGNKIVVAGQTENITDKALEYFVDTYLADGSNGIMKIDTFYKATADVAVIIDKGEPKYKLIRQYDPDEQETELFFEVHEAIYEVSDIEIPMGNDNLYTPEIDDVSYEILFGDVKYTQTAEVKKKINSGSYSIEFVGNKIVVCAGVIDALGNAVDKFEEILEYSCYTDKDGNSTLVLPKKSVTDDVFDFYTDIPMTANDVAYDSALNAHDGSMMLYWESATEEMLTSYAAAVEGLGFTKHQELDNTSIHSVTYAKDGVSVHVYLLKKTGELRAISQENANLPTNPPQTNPENLRNVKVTQISLYNDETTYTGMSYLIQLTDGTFVVIDGGSERQDNAEKLYNAMLDQKPSKFENIVVSAWILTNANEDHCGVLKYFMKHYNDTVIVKQLIGNDVSDLVYSLCYETREFDFSSVEGKFGGCVYTKAHTGQQFFFPGITFTVLYTQEDALQQGYIGYNDAASMVVDAVATSNAKRFLWLSDLGAQGGELLLDMYGDDLKCNVLQIANHGIKGVSKDVYEKCKPQTVFWCAGEAIENSNEWKSEANAWIRDNVNEIYYHGKNNYYVLCKGVPTMSGVTEGTDDETDRYTKFY